MTALTILLFKDTEKSDEFLSYYFSALREWNRDGLADTQIIMISQHEHAGHLRSICEAQPFPVEIVDAGHEFVSGYPIWDVLAGIGKAWPLVRGRWITTQHTEFLWCPGSLRRTIDWLERERLYMALGNLRRPSTGAKQRGSKEVSDRISAPMLAGDFDGAAQVMAALPTSHWVYWAEAPKSGETKWHEDVFFADREWFESWKMWEHGKPQPFQDIYDVMGRALQHLGRFNLAPTMKRAPLDVHRQIHLWHERHWGSFTPAIRDWFLSDPKRWAGTRFLDLRLWAGLIDAQPDSKPVFDLREGPGGTVTRYQQALAAWLRKGGQQALNGFYAAAGSGRRNAAAA